MYLLSSYVLCFVCLQSTITTTPLPNEQFMHEFQIIDENELISKFNLIQVSLYALKIMLKHKIK